MLAASLPPPLLLALTGLVGLTVGSFINVVVARLPAMMAARWRRDAAEVLDRPLPDDARPGHGLARPRSHCPHCRHPIRIRHNIPLLSFIWLRGRCADCGERIALRYPAIELAAGLLAIAAIARFGPTVWGGCVVAASWLLLALAAIDWRTQLLPDSLTLTLLWIGLLASLLPGTPGPSPTDAILGAALGYAVLWLVFQAFLAITGRAGMGHGDFKLAAALGAWVGWSQLPLTLLIASLAGALVGGTLIATGRVARSTPLPFGPWLALGGWLALIAGDTILDAYLTVSGLR